MNLRRNLSDTKTDRTLPFARRDASANSLNLHGEHPLYWTSYVHSPTPNRVRPQLPGDIEAGARYKATGHGRHGLETSVDEPLFLSLQSTNYSDSVESDLSRQSVMCLRHGRKLAPRKRDKTTTNGLEKSISGALVPTGRRLRHQVDALSPDTTFAQYLTKQEGTTVSPEICPDCIAEQEILARELCGTILSDDANNEP